MGNPSAVLRLFWPCIGSNLSVVSLLLSNGKCNHCFNNTLASHYRQSIRRFNSFLNGKLTVVSTIFWLCIVGNLSDVSIHLSNGKSNRCCINFFCLVLQAIYSLFQYLSQMGNRTVKERYVFWGEGGTLGNFGIFPQKSVGPPLRFNKKNFCPPTFR